MRIILCGSSLCVCLYIIFWEESYAVFFFFPSEDHGNASGYFSLWKKNTQCNFTIWFCTLINNIIKTGLSLSESQTDNTEDKLSFQSSITGRKYGNQTLQSGKCGRVEGAKHWNEFIFTHRGDSFGLEITVHVWMATSQRNASVLSETWSMFVSVQTDISMASITAVFLSSTYEDIAFNSLILNLQKLWESLWMSLAWFDWRPRWTALFPATVNESWHSPFLLSEFIGTHSKRTFTSTVFYSSL